MENVDIKKFNIDYGLINYRNNWRFDERASYFFNFNEFKI